MAETEKSTELLAKLAMITEAAQEAVNGKVSIVFLSYILSLKKTWTQVKHSSK
jgi:hypothetical protein